MRPIILVTTDRRNPTGMADSPRIRPLRPMAVLYEAYIQAVRDAGGLPLLVPPGEVDVERLLGLCQGIVLTGGDVDVHPSHYGQKATGRLDRIEEGRTHMELELARLALERNLPVLGVCGGMQVLAVAAGGTLIQDLPPASATHLAHEQPGDPAEPSHGVEVKPSVAQWFPMPLTVNSTHHQAVDQPGALRIVGTAPDGVAEIVWHPTNKFALGVQWHPELLGQLGPYKGLVAAART